MVLSWKILELILGHLGVSWSFCGARTRVLKIMQNYRLFMIWASWVPSGGVFGVSCDVLEASCAIWVASGAILDHLGGLLEVVLAL